MKTASLSIFIKPVIIFSKIFATFPLNELLEINFIDVTYTLVALLLCFVHLYLLPGIITNIEKNIEKPNNNVMYNYYLKIGFPAIVFIASIVSKINCLCFLRPNLKRYSKKITKIDPYLNVSGEDIKHHRIFSTFVLLAIIVLIIPVNIIRLNLLRNVSWEVVLLFGNMYFQNLSICSHEIQFVTLTYLLLIRIRNINQRLEILSKKLNIYFDQKYNKFTINKIQSLHHRSNKILDDSYFMSHCEIEYIVQQNSLFYFKLKKMINFLTLIHEIHKELRDAAVFLQKAYGLPLLFSLCCLSIMLLFDIYFEFYGFIGGNNSRLNWATYVWCLQYCVRFTLIVQIPQKIYDEVTCIF